MGVGSHAEQLSGIRPGPTEHYYARVGADSCVCPNNNKPLPRNSKRSDTGGCPYGWVFPSLHSKNMAIERKYPPLRRAAGTYHYKVVV